MSLIKKNKILFFICTLLVIMPFFWLKPGEMDLGGDGGRLYFYDPINLIKNLGSYYIFPFATGAGESTFHYLPFIGLMVILKQIIHSSYLLISLDYVLKIVVGFLAVYGIIKEFLKRDTNNVFIIELSSILAGLFYLASPAMTENYLKAIPSHDQVFLNPLMFYLMLKFFLTGSNKYMWVALLVSFFFAHSFSYAGAPPFFAFYPFAFVFIFLYSKFIRKVKIPWKKLFTTFVLFLGIHALHLIPEGSDLFTSGSNTNTRVFNTVSIKDQIGYFYGVLHIPKTSFYFFSYSLTKFLGEFAFVIPLIAILGLVLNKKKKKTILLAAVFFLITFFLVTGKVTMTGIKFYEWLFLIPGFNMFRNFYGQWQFVFYFFYSLFFGLSIFYVLQKIKNKFFSKIIFLVLFMYFVMSSWNFVNGGLVNPFREGARNIKGAIIMDPNYESALNFLRSLPDDSKVLVLPFSDSYVQVIHGLNSDGAFVGHTTIGQLTGKKDFAGYQDMSPYSAKFWELSKEKNYESIKKILGVLNIHYVFHNSDTRIYDDTFSGGPFSPNYTKKYLPATQDEYKDYIKGIMEQKIFEKGFYNIYKIDEKYFLPHFYIPDKIFVYNDDSNLDMYSKASAFLNGDTSERPLFIETQTCKKYFSEDLCDKKAISMENTPKIQFEKINPTKYKVKVFNATNPYVLTFSEAFHKKWKIYITNQNPKSTQAINTYFGGKIEEGKHNNIFFDGKTFETMGMESLPENIHFTSNGYANSWYIKPNDIKGRQDYEFIIEMTGQRFFYFGFGISALSLFILFLWVSISFLSQKKHISDTIKN